MGGGKGAIVADTSTLEPERGLVQMVEAMEDGTIANRSHAPKVLRVSLRKLYSMVDRSDKLLMVAGTFGAMVTAAGMPYFMVFFGKALDGFHDLNDIKSKVQDFALLFCIFGCIVLFTGFIQVSCWTITGERQALRIKESYVAAILRQNVAWFDEHPPGELPTTVTSIMGKITDGMGRKIPDVLMNGFGAIGCIIVAFYMNPQLAAIVLACLPLNGISVGMVAKMMSQSAVEGQKIYSRAGAVANEVIGGIRTVASLCSEEAEISRYDLLLDKAEAAGIKNGTEAGLGKAILFTCFYCSYALAFWYGTGQVADDIDANCTSNCMTGGHVISSVFGIVFSAMQLGQTVPGLTALNLARTSAVTVFDVIERVPPINCDSDEGLEPTTVKGELEFEHVGFSYPMRPQESVYNDVNLTITAGETVALVGPSGGGKSTMTKLFLRFYDPTRGRVLFDGVDIKTLNVRWYRRQIGYVGQEPVLFAGTIRDNIINGKPGASDEEVTRAAKAANAHDFIKSFPGGYNTEVGEGGLQMSGGQKQRIAIARAIIKDPAVLLLDEATSALDSESEKVVQQALDKLRELRRRTTITIAHRLSTIQNSDRIAVIANGGIAEIGTHASLFAQNGIYAQLCTAQGRRSADDTDDSVAIELQNVELESERKKSVAVETERQRTMSSSMAHADLVLKKPKATPDAELSLTEGPKAPLGRMWALNKPEFGWIAAGIFGSFVAGALFPLEGLVIAQLQSNYYLTDTDEMRKNGDKWSLAFVAMAGGAIIGYSLLSKGFSTSGERLTHRMRLMSFKSILRHQIGWFDSEKNSTGNLTIRLEQDTSAISRATGMNLGHICQLLMTLFAGVVIGMLAAWQVALVAVGCIPLIAVAGVIQMRMINGSDGDDEGLDGGSSAGTILANALNGISTVQAFNMQQGVTGRYRDAVKTSVKDRKRRGILFGASFGYSQANMFWVFALLFWYGSLLVPSHVDFKHYFVAMFAVILGAFGVGQVNSDAGAQKKGQVAAARIFALVDEPLPVDPLSPDGAIPTQVSGTIVFSNLTFAYPERPTQLVYGGADAPEGFSLTVQAGQTCALVGASGGGKSTCIALLMRFYEPRSGSITLDGRSIKELNLKWLRTQCGYVGQEPVLFQGTIFENILRGKPHASQDEVESAAMAANAHDFIMTFKQGYQTDIGEKSALLSGGQKQRIAIARAIIKDPAILLLDEATSALDNESERVVQAALDKLQAQKRRTTLVVAHRLTTISRADQIAVMGGGKVKELGSHEELMQNKDSWYKAMYERQTAHQ